MSAALSRALAVAAMASVLALSACGGSAESPSVPPLVPDSSTSATADPPGSPETSSAGVSISKIGASSTLVPLGLNADRTVEVPPVSEPEQAGVYANGPTPGDPGPAVILGHVNGGGRPGVFARLSEVTTGDEVDVRRDDGRTAVFRVYRKDTIDKDAFPTSAVYSDTEGPELRLITCGGDLDTEAHSYLSNVIVFAALTSLR